MTHPLPKGRIGLKALLGEAGISKNTFFRKYRYDPETAKLLDIDEDRDHRLHFRADAGATLKRLHGKMPHGNRGRAPSRVCPKCHHPLHPRNRACEECGHAFVSGDEIASGPKRSSADVNFRRREQLQAVKRQNAD